jgi:hypothetical protein
MRTMYCHRMLCYRTTSDCPHNINHGPNNHTSCNDNHLSIPATTTMSNTTAYCSKTRPPKLSLSKRATPRSPGFDGKRIKLAISHVITITITNCKQYPRYNKTLSQHVATVHAYPFISIHSCTLICLYPSYHAVLVSGSVPRFEYTLVTKLHVCFSLSLQSWSIQHIPKIAAANSSVTAHTFALYSPWNTCFRHALDIKIC